MRPWRPGVLRGARHFAAVAALCLLSAACAAPRVDFEILSEEPIALTWWEAEVARQRAELLAEEDSRRALQPGVAQIGDIGRYLSRSDRAKAAEQKYPGRLVLLDPRTRSISRVEQAPPGARALAWSPDHQRLLFSSDHITGVHQLYELNRGTGNVRRLSRGSDSHILGAYGPEGHLAYSTFRLRGGELETRLVVKKRGSRQPETVVEGVAVQDLSFAPDGSRLVFTVLEDPRNVKAEGRPILISREPEAGGEAKVLGRGKNPVFTPDGEWIVFSAPVKAGWRIKRMRPDGSARISVGRGVVDEREPAVAPDGASIVYIANSTGLDQLFVRRFDGTGDRLLLDKGAVAFPVW